MNLAGYSVRLRADSAARSVAVLIVIFGAVLRIVQYGANRSLWFDEAYLALNIVERSYLELTQPLSYNQGAPIGFLFIEEFFTQLLGNQDYVLRLFPLMAGILSLLVMYKLARRFLLSTGMIIAVALFSVSHRLIYYASEVKQYSSDVLFTLLLLWVGYKCLQPEFRPRHYLALMLTGVVSMWLSHPALFILAGVGCALVLDQHYRRDRSRLLWLAITFLVWGLNFAILYVASLRTLAANVVLLDHWRNEFLPMPPWREPAWIPNAFLAMLENPGGLVGQYAIYWGMLMFLLGCISIAIRKWRLAPMLIVPFPVILLASGLEKYPFGERLLLFILPVVFCLIGEGVARIYSMVRQWNSVAAGCLYLLAAGGLLYGPTNLAIQNLLQPPMVEDIKPLLAHVQQQRLEPDHIYVYYGAAPAFSFYAPFYGFAQDDYTLGIWARQEPTKYLDEIEKVRVYGRVWFMFSHTDCRCVVDEEAYFLAHLDKVGTRMDEFHASEASLYLYSLDAPGQ